MSMPLLQAVVAVRWPMVALEVRSLLLQMGAQITTQKRAELEMLNIQAHVAEGSLVMGKLYAALLHF